MGSCFHMGSCVEEKMLQFGSSFAQQLCSSNEAGSAQSSQID